MPPEAAAQAATIARLETQVEHLIAALSDFKAAAREEREEVRRANETLQKRLDSLEEQMRSMQTVISEAKGGWKTLAAAIGLAGVVGSGLTWVANHWKG